MDATIIDRLSDEDAAILKLGKGAIRGHTCKVLVLERAGGRPLPTLEAIRDHVNARLDKAPRFRQRVVRTPLGLANPVWLDDPDFDIARHVTRIPSPAPIGREALRALVAGRIAERLDRAHPLWHLDVVEELEHDHMALIWRVHHSLADGTTCVKLGAALLWNALEDDDGDLRTDLVWQPHAAPGPIKLLARGVADRLGGQRRADGRSPNGHSPSAYRDTIARELRPTASLTPLADRVSPRRVVGFAAAPLEACKRAGKAVDDAVTVNDIVLSIIAGAVRDWLGPTESIRVKVPVSLHRRGEDDTVGNHNSYFFVDLPVAEPDPAKRLLAINRETGERKLGHDAETLYRLGTHPIFAHLAMSPHVFTFNVSNVRGPAGDVFVVGARLRELYSLAEIAQHHALRVAVMSATGSLFFGLCADQAVVTDLQGLADGLQRSTEQLLAVAR